MLFSFLGGDIIYDLWGCTTARILEDYGKIKCKYVKFNNIFLGGIEILAHSFTLDLEDTINYTNGVMNSIKIHLPIKNFNIISMVIVSNTKFQVEI